jgi:FKBP-type peptidyl-prolyl cis-trans isomerase
MKYLLIVFSIAFIIGCDSSEDKNTTESGIRISYFKKGSKELEKGKLLLINTRYETEDGYPILQSKPMEPMAMLYDDESVEEAGLVKEVIDNLKVGDSVYFEIPAKNLFEVTFDLEVPDTINSESNLKFYFGIEAQVEQNGYLDYIYQKRLKAEKLYFDKEEKYLAKYIKDSVVNVVETKEGLYYTITEEGTGDKIVNGDSVVAKYSGKILEGGQFDTGVYPFKVGEGEVIKGWDIGFTYLSEKSKAVLYIPSRLGYGSSGNGSIILPYTTLIFEVEVLEVKKAEK